MSNKFFGIDFGGTNLRIGEVKPSDGEVIDVMFDENITTISNNEDLTNLILSHIPKGSEVGICAAGNVDEKNLVIIESPNSKIKGKITFGRDLANAGSKVSQTNDMKAAVQAEARYGEGKQHRNVLVATYSSGYNCAVTRDLENVTTAEFGHIPYGGELYCGCGKIGHLEPYVSGNGAASMAKQFFGMNRKVNHSTIHQALERFNQDNGTTLKIEDLKNPGVFDDVVSSISSKDVYMSYRESPKGEPQKYIRNTQVRAIADSFAMMNSAYNPLDIMVLMGSQTKDWDILFKPAINIYQSGENQMDSLGKPEIVKSRLPMIGIQGAVAYHLKQQTR